MTYKEKKLQEFRSKFTTAWPHDELMSCKDAEAFLESTIDEIIGCLPKRMEGYCGTKSMEDFEDGYNYFVEKFVENLESLTKSNG